MPIAGHPAQIRTGPIRASYVARHISQMGNVASAFMWRPVPEATSRAANRIFRDESIAGAGRGSAFQIDFQG